MKKVYAAIILLLLTGTTRVFATHIMGMDLSYTCTGSNNYTFTLNYYRDCSGINVSVKYLHLVSKSNGYSKLVKLTEVGTPQNISLVCPSDVNKTTCNGGTITGTQKWVFTATVTLPYYAKDWVFYYDDYARNNAITNLVNPGNDGIRVVDSLDNSAGNCINSPVFTTIPTPYVCNMLQTNYNHGGFDPDGDSLSYQFVAPLDSFGNAVKYVSPFTYSSPLALDSGSFKLNPSSGEITFTPSGTQITVTAVRVNAYDKTGKLVGYVTRDIEIVVLNCSDQDPTESWYYNLTGAYQSGTNVVTGCVGNPLSFDIHGTDVNVADSVYLTTNLGTIIPGAKFTTTPGLPNATATVTWTPALADTGTHYFTVTVKDNYCPIFNEQVYSYGIVVSRGVHATGGGLICKGSSKQLTVYGGSGYTWSPSSSLSCSTCTSPIATPSVTTTYIVTGSTSPLVCKTADTVVVTVDTFKAHASPHLSAVCIGKNVQLNGTGGSSLTWAPSTGLSCTSCGNPVATPTITTSFVLTSNDANSCVSHDTAKVVVNTLPNVKATSKSLLACYNSLDTLNASGASNYIWSPASTLSSSTGAQVSASPTTTTSYTVTGTDANGCVNTATVSDNVNPQLSASVGASGIVPVSCFGGNNGSATASATGGSSPYTYSWNTSPVQKTATATNLSAGTYTVTATDKNGCSASSTVIISQPSAALSASISSNTAVSCFGNATGSATVTANGGTTPYSYSWNTTPVQTGATAANLSGGSYTVTITDKNGCSTTANVVISQPTAALSASISSNTAVSCFGNATGSATVTANGGTTPYSYSWNTTPVQTGATAANLSAGSYTVTITDKNGCSTSANVVISQPSAALGASISSNIAVSCFGNANGSATVSANGGTTPYSYSWNTTPVQTSATASNLSAGSYTVTVTDKNGCSASANVVISQPSAALGASISSNSAVSCFGNATGSATVSANGGTNPYSYSWNTTPVQTSATASNLSAGSYTVTVTDKNGCTTTANAVISQPTATLSASINSNTVIPVSCFGNANGSATVSVNGGTTPYSYSWNTIPVQTSAIASNLSAGTYTVTITDKNGCSTTANAVISQPSAPLNASVGANAIVPVSCFGNANGSATVSVSGGTTPYSYSWNTTPVQTGVTASNLSAGTYTVTVTDFNGCTASANVVIAQPKAALNASITAQTNVSCFGGAGSATVTVNGGTTPYSYSWNTTPVQTSATASNLSAGTYTVTVTDFNGCTTTATAIVSQPQGALGASVTSSVPVSCFGNANGSATVTASAGTTPYSYSWNTVPVQTSATATNLSAGTYAVTVTDFAGCSTVAMVAISQPKAALSASVNANGVIPVSCFGNSTGSAIASVSGGTTPYSYSWNTTPAQTKDTAANLSAGSYTITVTDSNGCTASANVVISQPQAPLNASVGANAITPVSCFGENNGSATASVSGGTTPYSYSWNTTPVQTTATASNLSAGTYTVNITDFNGCTASASVVITQPKKALSASISSQDNVSCFDGNNGSATVSVSGGTASHKVGLPNFYTYSWNTVPVQTGAKASNLSVGTYTVIVTDSNGCTTSATVVISQPQAPLNVSVNANTVIPVSCFGSANGSATANASGGTTPYSYSWNTTPVQTGATASNLAAGTYTVNVIDSNGCNTSMNVVIKQPKAPLNASVSANAITPVSCFGNNNGSATVSVSGGTTPYSYSWNTTPAQTGATASNLSAGTYVVNITDSNGCTASTNVVISQPQAALNASISAQTNVSCFGGAGSATATVNGGTTPYSYSWNTTPVQTSATASNLEAGTYTVNITDSNGCTTSAAIVITQPVGALSVAVTSSIPVSCFGNANGSATAVASLGTAPYVYDWSTSPVQTTAIASNLSAGTYTVTVTDSLGCINTASVVINQPQAPLSASISANAITAVSCFGNNNGSATVSVSGGTTPYTYSWNTSPVQNGTTASNLAAGTYTVTVTDSNNCTTTTDVVISQPLAALNAAITAQIPVACYGNATGSATVIVSGGTTPYTYLWNTTPAQDAPMAAGLPAGTYTVTVTDLNNCTTTATATIAQPAAALNVAVNSPATSVCNGTPITLTAAVTGGTGNYTYNWIPGTSAVDSMVVNPATTTTYTVVITDSNNCTTTGTTTINVNQLPVISVGANPLAICLGNSDTLKASGATAYTWSPALGLSSTDGSVVLANPTVSTTYTITGTNGIGCTNTTTTTVVVNPLPKVSLSGLDSNYCGNSNAAITLIGIPPAVPPQGFYSGASGVQSGLTGIFYPDSAGGPGNYNLTYTYRNDTTGCVNSASVQVAVLPAPNVTITTNNPNICLGNSTSLTASGGDTYTWTPSTTLSCASCSSTIASPTATTTYTVDATIGACSASASVTIGVYSTTVKAGPDQHILYGNSAQLTASGADYYSWTPGNSLNNDSISDPIASPTVTTTYIVTGTDSLGCVSVDTVVIYVSNPCESLMMPTAFTPAGNENRYFHVLNVGGVALQDFKVFNRWGQMVYEATSIDERGWDGTFAGKPQPMGTYVYYAEILCQGQTVFIKGDVTLIR